MPRTFLLRDMARGRRMREMTTTWIDPTTGAIYHEGDRVELRFTDHGAYYNEEIIRVECGGFPGGALVDQDSGIVMEIDELEPTGAVFVGPASEAWAWQYRQAQWCKHLAIQKANVAHYD